MARPHKQSFYLHGLIIFAAFFVRPAEGASERRWTFKFENIFRGGTKPLLIYARERGGTWIAGVGSSRDPEHQGRVRKTYNRSWYCADLSRVPITTGAIKGEITVHMTPDLWVPRDHTGFTMVIDIDAAVTGKGTLRGRYKILEINSGDESVKDFGTEGEVTATSKLEGQPPLPDPATFICNMQGSVVGGEPSFTNRCMILFLGVEKGRLVSAAYGYMDKKFNAYNVTALPLKGNSIAAGRDRFAAHVAVPTKTLDMEPCRYFFKIDGFTCDKELVGTYHLKAQVDGKKDVIIKGSFDGDLEEGVTHYKKKQDDRPWFVSVKNFTPVKSGEHPRLLFRRKDLPALRKKAERGEGKEILARLRRTLDGKNGESMPVAYNPCVGAAPGDGAGDFPKKAPLGSYTFGHVAGYGLLYQLNGEKQYAELGKNCFEKALEGVRDVDRRYSFQHPYGDLRAGPVLGWMAVGFDLCYDGWSEATREKFGRKIAEYKAISRKKTSTLEKLVRGTMPPASNHYGMQVGGAALALLAVTGERWVDQENIDRLLAISRDSMIRNARDGFGDGGHFAEGDGTGSMSSHIVYLTAVQAWRNVVGVDFVNTERPNIRTMALKWIYQTVVRDGRPDFWPIRGAYGHNVWDRDEYGKSGAGYFAVGLGGVREREKAALSWFYNRFFLKHDRKRGGAYDTVSRYPHLSVSSFVNWPVHMQPVNPEEVLPHCYRDAKAGFYLWRNRWQDRNDTVITVLTNRTQGYMPSRPDRKLRLNTMGKHLSWGSVCEGKARYWNASPRGETSSLTLSDGSSFGVDFTGRSGSDVLLVTTGNAEGTEVQCAGKTLTFYFPTTDDPPEPKQKGDAVVIGGQRVTIEDGTIVFGFRGE